AQVFSMVVVALADVHSARAEEAAKLLQRTPTRDALRHNKPVRHLEPGSVASAAPPDVAVGRTRWRSIPLRLQSQSPSRAGSVFPAGFLHPWHCHGIRHLGRYS